MIPSLMRLSTGKNVPGTDQFPGSKIRRVNRLYLISTMDPRYYTLAKNLVSHSVNLQAGEKIIHAFDVLANMSCPRSDCEGAWCTSFCSSAVLRSTENVGGKEEQFEAWQVELER